MRLKLEKRPEPSRLMVVVTPIASVLLTMLIGVVVFDAIGINGQKAVVDIFLTPLLASYKWQDVAVKAAPLIIIALGLSVGNRANVWNIGAEGQYIIGALCAAGIGIAAGGAGGGFIITLMMLAGHRRRHGLGGGSGAAEDAVLGQRNPLEPDADLCGAAGAGLPRRRAVEGPQRAQFSGDGAADAGAEPADPLSRHDDPSGCGNCGDPAVRLLGGDGALGVRLPDPGGGQRAARGAARRLRQQADDLARHADRRRHGGARRRARVHRRAQAAQPRLSRRATGSRRSSSRSSGGCIRSAC